jgi:uncharacterized protein
VIDLDDYDCVKCGACCVSDYDAEDYVILTVDDIAQLNPEEAKAYVYTDTTYGEPQRSMKTARDSQDNCRCAALEGVVGRRVGCAIYDRRPKVCRGFDPETDVCDFARQMAFGVSLK